MKEIIKNDFLAFSNTQPNTKKNIFNETNWESIHFNKKKEKKFYSHSHCQKKKYSNFIKKNIFYLETIIADL